MAISQVGSATTATDDGSTGSITITKPTGVASGHVLIVTLASNLNGYTVPSGFTQFMVSTDTDTPNSFRSYMYYKVCGGSEPASYTFDKTSGGDGAPVIGVMSAWSGVDTTTGPIAHTSYVGGGSSGEPANPATSFTQTAPGRVLFCRNVRSTTALPTFSTGTSGWSELGEAADFSGGTVRYGCSMYAKTSDTSSGSQTEPGVTCSTTETDNVYFLFELMTYVPPVNAPAGSGSIALSAKAATVTTTRSASGATHARTAHNATVLTGKAAEPTAAGISYGAHDAVAWVIGKPDVGLSAYNASVAIGTAAEVATISYATLNAVGYYGAPASRRWSIPAEDRTLKIERESRVWNIPSED